mmetsp:Transcript_16056/g.51500  ORF Transcript_16056/g.51500 Transcript_16056/m.51500 type:complete len:205 (-) Transcript_16056:43-657(-)
MPNSRHRPSRTYTPDGRSRRDGDELHVEDQRGVGRNDAARAARAVPEIGRDLEHPLLPHLHVEQRLVPALDDAADAHLERERRPAVVARVELGAVLQVACVMRLDLLAGGRLDAVALLHDLVLQAGRRGLEALEVVVGEGLVAASPLAIGGPALLCVSGGRSCNRGGERSGKEDAAASKRCRSNAEGCRLPGDCCEGDQSGGEA